MRMRERVTNKKRQEMDKKKFDAFRNEEVEMVWFAYPANFWATISLVAREDGCSIPKKQWSENIRQDVILLLSTAERFQGMKLVGEMLLKSRKWSMYTYA